VRRIALLVVAAMAAVGMWAQSALAASNAAVTVNVTATEFKFKLSKLSVPKGSTVTFKVVNKGNAPHDFDFSALGKGTPYLAHGKSASYKVTFNKPGSYRFVCTVPRHVELGMSGSFRVK
jgi:plastocyanin